MRVRACSRGAAFDDLDNDGDVDAVIVNLRGAPTLLENKTQTRHQWLGVKLHGQATNRDGVGARVSVTAGDLRLVDEVHSGRGYQGHHGSQLHFGLGERDQVDLIEVQWIGGESTVVRDVLPGQVVTIRESLSKRATIGAQP